MSIFITSTGTDQGKTYVTRLLCYQLGQIHAIKPVISGFEPNDKSSDSSLIIEASQSGMTVEQCSPWRFKEPVSPDLAAKLENKEINFNKLVEFCARQEVELIEGAGGIMSPITPQHTNLDLIEAVKADIILVSALYLGCISHILTALEVVNQRNLAVKALVLTPISVENMSAETVLASLTPQLSDNIPLFVLEYEQNLHQNWKNQPDLTSVSLSK